MLTLVKWLIPGSFLFFLVATAIGVVLLHGRGRWPRIGRHSLTSLLAFYLLLSLQGTSDLLVAGLSRGYKSLGSAEEAHRATVIVVLGNGSRVRAADGLEISSLNLQSSMNVLEAARLYRVLGNPTIVASGGVPSRSVKTPESDTMARALVELGIPRERIVTDSSSLNTWQQARNVGEWLGRHGSPEFVLVTSPEHMLRSARAFSAFGLTPRPSLSWLRYGGSPFWQPTLFALEGSERAMYEYLAIGFYWIRGRF